MLTRCISISEHPDNAELAARAALAARQHPPRSPGRGAAAACWAALITTKTPDGARRALADVGDPTARAAAAELLGGLLGEARNRSALRCHAAMLLLAVPHISKGSDHMRYVVARVITSPAGAVKTARLLITDVPAGTALGDVLAALEAAGKSAEFSEAGVPFGNHEIKPDSRGWPWGIHAIDEAPAITWAKLITPPTRGEGRRVTLRLTDAEHARYSLAAQRSGVSLQEWFVTAAEALAAEQAGSGPEAMRRFMREHPLAGKAAEGADAKAAS